MNWNYESEEITSLDDLPRLAIGFVYLITLTSGKKYIGKKYLYSTVTMPLLKSGLQRAPKTCKGYISSEIKPRLKKEIVTKESNWLDYEGSSKLIPSTDLVTNKVILYVCSNKNCVSYLEEYQLFIRKAVLTDEYYNKSIQGRHFDNALEGLLWC